MTDMPEPGQMEEDWLYMQQLYPNTARKLVYYIEDAADRRAICAFLSTL